jgi:hypothetical protein
MNNMKIKIEGMDKLSALMNNLSNPETVDKMLTRAVHSTSKRLQKIIELAMPVASGRRRVRNPQRLKDSIRSKFSKDTARTVTGLLTNQFYSVLDNGRPAYYKSRRKGEPKTVYRGTSKFKSRGLKIGRIYSSNKAQLVEHFNTVLQKVYNELAANRIRR